MTSFTTGKSASSAVSKKGSVSSGSFKAMPRASSGKSQTIESSFKVGTPPKSAFSTAGSSTYLSTNPKKVTSSFSTGGKKTSSFGHGEYNKPVTFNTPTPIKAVISNPVKIGTKVDDTYLGTKVTKKVGKFVQPVLVTSNNNGVDKIKPVTPMRTITFKQTTKTRPTFNPTLPVKESTRPIYKTLPVAHQDIIDNVRNFQKNYVPPTKPKPKSSSSGGGSSSGSSGKWGGTGSLQSPPNLSADEKLKKGITGTAYTQGADKIKRMAKSYNTGKNEMM